MLRFHDFVDARTAVLWKNRGDVNAGQPPALLVVDVETGGIEERTFVPRKELSPREKESRVEFLGCQIVGPYLVSKTARSEDHVRLTVWNWRTGQELLDREFECSNAGVVGDFVWTHPSPTDSDRPVTALYSISTGRRLSSKLPAWVSPRRASPDGRIWLEDRDRHRFKEVEAWSLDSGTPLFTAEADRFAFSADSHWLATVACREAAKDRAANDGATKDGWVRSWRIYDLRTGSIAAERQEPISRKNVAAVLVSDLEFHDGGECVALYGYSDGGVGNPASPPPRDAVDVWVWREGDLRPIRASRPVSKEVSSLYRRSQPWLRQPRSRWKGEAELPSRYVVDGDAVIDVVTQGRVGTLPPTAIDILAVAPPWAMIRTEPGPIGRQLAAISKRVAGEMSLPRICDLSTGTTVAWLGRGHSIFEFSPEGRWLLTHDNQSVEIWGLPVRRAVLQPFLWSLLVPLLGGLFSKRFRGGSRRPPLSAVV